ncbi:hypothetical protein SAMN02745166_00276 [Prosthecobacter debontii]|uniref:ParE toxin of type II toxin-antitoxin system, parDE n=1 Tax=Prosthecobacter debontii TaxID=48467 RepID=A0A1T4WJ77_9BACT|nr:type II toxin-antitoxin system RelE/ParE family toxin [Prosthecobacter debontii]SKA76958.1 hypothetical protein SAMN02745166_00276 [Prosthecobacter debontii]
MPAKIYPSAEERILEIWDYSKEQWGEKQTNAYVSELVAEIERVAGQRHRWRPFLDDELTGGYFFSLSASLHLLS